MLNNSKDLGRVCKDNVGHHDCTFCFVGTAFYQGGDDDGQHEDGGQHGPGEQPEVAQHFGHPHGHLICRKYNSNKQLKNSIFELSN